MIDKSKIGKRSRKAGKRFELAVWDHLQENWFICKWSNTVDLEKKMIVKVKPKFNPFTKQLMMNSGGFPDYVMWGKGNNSDTPIGVECKGGKTGKLDRKEKDMANWLLKERVFSIILIARQSNPKKEDEQGIKIVFDRYIPDDNKG